MSIFPFPEPSSMKDNNVKAITSGDFFSKSHMDRLFCGHYPSVLDKMRSDIVGPTA